MIPLLLVGSLFVLTPPAPQACGCVAPGDAGFEAGLVWQGSEELDLQSIAGLVAPLLWFSTDEPLLIEGLGPLPSPHPCDPDASGPVVYYQLRSLRLRGDARVSLPPEEESELWSKVSRLTLRFYFYYPEDRGFGGHLHDLEVTELEVSLETTPSGCRRVLLRRAMGFAHGLDWYYNELDVHEAADTRYPLTFFVEEGKHASCPDRNADGVYTPGYDVNRRVNDAWGVRDVLGSGFLGTSNFQASMAKPRELAYRVGPPETSLACRDPRNSSFARSEELMARYELRSARGVPSCATMGPDSERLLGMMDDHGFGPEHEPHQGRGWEIGELAEPLAYSKSWLPPIVLRRDQSTGLGFSLAGLDLGEFGYLVPRVNYTFSSNDVAIETMLMPSASQVFSWYVSAGAARERSLVAESTFLPSLYPDSDRLQPWGPPEWNFVSEIGVKFRARLPGRWRMLALGYHFAGVRFGLRSSGFNDLSRFRMIVEIGAGIF